MDVTRVGQGVQRAFTGKVGQRVAVVLTNPDLTDNGCTTLALFDPTGAPIGNSQVNCGNGNPVGIGPVDLTISGTYLVRVEVDTTATGTGTLWVSKPVTVGTVSINGSAQPMNVTRVGRGVQRTFRGTAGQSISAVITNPVTSDNACETLTLLAPSGATVDGQANCGNGNPVGLGPDTLPATGTYTVRLEVGTTATARGPLKVSA